MTDSPDYEPGTVGDPAFAPADVKLCVAGTQITGWIDRLGYLGGMGVVGASADPIFDELVALPDGPLVAVSRNDMLRWERVLRDAGCGAVAESIARECGRLVSRHEATT